eukprot:Blabericola_migrator_1__3628@NODE_2085_length_3295_cov_588_127323_g1322_i0_p2_GENE_NODE_2085_length_3295_cov_588_127323_g1322_i0NODE_2085_length_3295_cov_588_127323_g1322_i0_p2_ORF_typecomplete_len355_score44_83_NODE_2085_length_3295_cov_588_127323_g1322_i016012665
MMEYLTTWEIWIHLKPFLTYRCIGKLSLTNKAISSWLQSDNVERLFKADCFRRTLGFLRADILTHSWLHANVILDKEENDDSDSLPDAVAVHSKTFCKCYRRVPDPPDLSQLLWQLRHMVRALSPYMNPPHLECGFYEEIPEPKFEAMKWHVVKPQRRNTPAEWLSEEDHISSLVGRFRYCGSVSCDTSHDEKHCACRHKPRIQRAWAELAAVTMNYLDVSDDACVVECKYLQTSMWLDCKSGEAAPQDVHQSLTDELPECEMTSSQSSDNLVSSYTDTSSSFETSSEDGSCHSSSPTVTSDTRSYCDFVDDMDFQEALRNTKAFFTNTRGVVFLSQCETLFHDPCSCCLHFGL